MTIASIARPAPAPLAALHNARPFGRVDVDNRIDPFLIAGSRIGRAEGYESLANARRALAILTRGDRPAGAVFEHRDRFYTTGVDTFRPFGSDTYSYRVGNTWAGDRGVYFNDRHVAALVDDKSVFLNR